MEKLIAYGMTIVIVGCLVAGAQALRDINDGRIHLVVRQMVNPADVTVNETKLVLNK
jgi:hypothetical protein